MAKQPRSQTRELISTGVGLLVFVLLVASSHSDPFSPPAETYGTDSRPDKVSEDVPPELVQRARAIHGGRFQDARVKTLRNGDHYYEIGVLGNDGVHWKVAFDADTEQVLYTRRIE